MPDWAFAPIDRPTYADKLKFPENLPALSSKDLGLYHGHFVGMHAYASSELSKIQVQILRLESELSVQRNNRYVALASQGEPKWKIDRSIESGQKIIDSKDRLLVLQIKRETVLSYMLNFERYASAISREMSRRASEMRLS